jgi:hypothetical protein
MNRRPVDPHIDPLRAPSERGQHPHMAGDDREQNPQQMYEQRDTYGEYRRTPGNSPIPASAQSTLGILGHPMVLLGLGALAAFGISKLLGDNADDDDDLEVEESVVAAAPAVAAPAPAPAPIVVTMPALPAPVPNEGATVKRRRVRRTTQARSQGGRYEKSGTRKRAHTEGKS